MAVLTLCLNTITEADYDGVNETNKELCGDIDGVKLVEMWIEESTVSDTDCKTNFKTHLTSLGYTWDSEA